MLQDIQTAIPLGILLSITVGPVFFVLLQTAAIQGFRAAITFDIGVIAADVVFILLAYFSSRQFLENLKNQPGLFIVGGVLLVGYGLLLFSRAKKTKFIKAKSSLTKTGILGLFVKGFLLNFINVGVLLFWLSIIVFIGPALENDANRIFIFFSVVMLSYLVTDVCKILLAKQLKKRLTLSLVIRVKKGIGLVLSVCGLFVMCKGLFSI